MLKAANVARVYVTESLGRDFILVHPRGVLEKTLEALGDPGGLALAIVTVP